MSDSVRPHRRKLTRLPHPWDSPGKNTGVGYHFLLQCTKVKREVKSLSRVQLFVTPWTAAHQAPPSMAFSRQEYWSGVPLPSPSSLLKTILLMRKLRPVEINLSKYYKLGNGTTNSSYERECLILT